MLLAFAIPLFPAGKKEIKKESDSFANLRLEMVKTQIRARGITDPAVLTAMKTIPRHLFVPENIQSQAYEDHPLRIGEGQTISQPYIVALMTESLGLKGEEKVLEIGTGSGYQAAVLSGIVREVYTIEIKELLYQRSSKLLGAPQYNNVISSYADGYYGWTKYAPFDCIMITAAVNHIPPPLLKQLKPGGKMILPLGDPYSYQQLVLVTKYTDKYTVMHITGVLFVPMTGKAIEE